MASEESEMMSKIRRDQDERDMKRRRELHSLVKNFLLPNEDGIIPIKQINSLLEQCPDDIDSAIKLEGEPARFTLLQRAVGLFNTIRNQQQTQHFIYLIKGLLGKDNAYYFCTKISDIKNNSVLDFLLPVNNSNVTYPKLEDRTLILEFLFQMGAYKINVNNANAALRQFSKNDYDGKKFRHILQCILFVQDVRKKVIEPLEIEYKRLLKKYPEGNGRTKILEIAIDDLKEKIDSFQSERYRKPTECWEQLKKSIHENLIRQENTHLTKYNDDEQRGRRYLNILLGIFTGIFPEIIYYAYTGHGFLSPKGKTADTATNAHQNLENLPSRHMCLSPGSVDED